MLPRQPQQVVGDWRLGRHYGYPACCIAHYCWDQVVGWPSALTRQSQIHGDPSDPSPQVVCGILHAGGSPYRLGERLRRIIRFNWWQLQPIAAGRWRRELERRRVRDRRTKQAELRWFVEEASLARRYGDGGDLDPELEWS